MDSEHLYFPIFINLKCYLFKTEYKMNWINLLILVMIATGGFIATTYEVLARDESLPVGRMYRNNGLFTIVGGIITFAAIIASAFINPWWSIFIVAVTAWLLGQLTVVIIKSISQLVAPLLIVSGLILLLIYTI